MKKATFAAGCFWCVEAIFEMLEGVEDVVSGYAGGTAEKAHYGDVSTGATGHAEVVDITYNPAKITYKELLDVFWGAHDPTTPNRQGADEGPQYRSAIFYRTQEEKRLAEESKKEQEASGKFPQKIVTEIIPLTAFFKAEDKHQDYYRANTGAPYCQVVITSKLKHVEEEFKEKIKKNYENK